MKHRDSKNFDQLIEEAVHEEFNSINSPISSEEAWEIFVKRRNQKRQNNNVIRRIFPSKKFVYLASSILIFIGLIWAPQSGAAFSKLTEIFNKVQDNVVQLFVKVGSSTEREDGPDSDEVIFNEGSGVISKQMSLEEAQKATLFSILVPKSVPSEFDLKNVIVIKKSDEKSKEIYLNYVGSKKEFKIREMVVGDEFGLGATFDQEDTEVVEVNINGHPATLLKYKKNYTGLVWVTQNFYYSIEGNLTEGEILLIAESM
jgi:hypothetical protein